MQTDIALATLLQTDPGALAATIVGGVAVLAALYMLVGLAVTLEINRTISAIHQKDTPAR